MFRESGFVCFPFFGKMRGPGLSNGARFGVICGVAVQAAAMWRCGFKMPVAFGKLLGFNVVLSIRSYRKVPEKYRF